MTESGSSYSGIVVKSNTRQKKERTPYEKQRDSYCDFKYGHLPFTCSSATDVKFARRNATSRYVGEIKLNISIERNGHVVTATAKSNSTVVMQTPRTLNFGKDAVKKVPVTILFHSGNQKSFVLESLQKKLGLQVEKTETMTLSTFWM